MKVSPSKVTGELTDEGAPVAAARARHRRVARQSHDEEDGRPPAPSEPHQGAMSAAKGGRKGGFPARRGPLARAGTHTAK